MAFKSRTNAKKAPPKKEKGDRPVLTVRAPHGLKVSVWENEYDSDRKDGETFIAYSSLPVRSYYDDAEKEYKDTHYLREDDLLPMAALLTDAWHQIQESKAESDDDGGKPDDGDDDQKLPPY